jgi:hypothetical protein
MAAMKNEAPFSFQLVKAARQSEFLVRSVHDAVSDRLIVLRAAGHAGFSAQYRHRLSRAMAAFSACPREAQ